MLLYSFALRSGLFSLALLCASLVMAQTPQNEALLLKSGTIYPEANVQSLNGLVGQDHPRHCYLQFNTVPNSKQREIMLGNGIQLMDYLPHKTYIAALPAGFDLSKLQEYNVRSLIEIQPEYKMAVPLIERPLPEHAVVGDEVKINFQYYRDANPNKIQAALEAEGLTVLSRYDFGRKFSIQIPQAEIETFAALEFVAYLETIDPPADPENYTGRTNHRNNVIAVDHAMGRHYDGTGVNVAMGDDGIIGPHIDYRGREDQSRVNSNGGDHGDHVAGIIMGAGNKDPKGRGQAFGATLHVYDVWDAVNDSPTDYYSDSIRVTSTSYGNGCNAGYTSFAQSADETIRQNPGLMHVFSAGNSGSSDCGYGAGSGWGNVTGGVKAGKNVTAVANLGATDNLANSSSRGPASDGRIKPDMAAVGTSVYSTVDVNDYENKSGTSMACPGVSGTYAQLIHAYRSLNGTDPESALLKALLMNGAEDLGNDGPDFKYGFGRINGANAVRTMEDGRYQSYTLDQGDSITTNITVPAGTQEFRVMVYWTDYEGSTQSSIALVNDLDMVVTDPTNATFDPWVLDHTPNPTNLDLPATRGVDHLNNVEQVTIDNPVAGSYEIKIKGFQVPQGPQTCYVVWEAFDDGVELTYPIGGEGLVPGEGELVRWDAYGTTGTFDLEYTLDGGASWNTMTTNLPGDSRYYNWTVPSTTTGEVMVRVTRNGMSDESDAFLSIVRLPLSLNIDWICPDSLQISWNPAIDATSYDIFQLGSKYMDSIGTTTATSFVVQGTNPFAEDWFSVRSRGANGAVGRRAIAIEKPQGIFNCALPNDAALLEIVNPGAGTLQGCNNITNMNVTVRIKNDGVANITDVPVYYDVPGAGGTQMDTYIGTIMPDSVVDFTFSTPVTLGTNTSYLVSAWTAYANDANTTNDTMTANVQTTSNGATVTLPWSDDFESNSNCNTQSNCGQVSCSLNNDWVQGSNTWTDNIDWREDRDGTPSDGTGPDVDHNPGNSQGIYLYLEASAGCNFQVANLTTPCFDLTTATHPRFEFWYHAFGGAMGELHVDVLTSAGWDLEVVQPEIGNQGNTWRQKIVDLDAYAGQLINVRLRGITGADYESDLAIDDVSIYDIVSVEENLLLPELVIYPNPTRGLFTVDFGDSEAQVDGLKVYSAVGELVLDQQITSNSGRLDVALESPSAGVYFVEITAGDQSVIRKLIVQ